MPPIDPLSAGVSLGTGILSYLGGQEANRQNVQLQRETNALNYKMMLQNQGFQQAMFQKQLDAQDPAFLRRRLEDAGYNPAALVAGANGMLGTAPSSSPTPPVAAQSPHVTDPITPAVQIASQGMSVLADAKNKLEESKGKAIDNQFKAAHWEKLIDGLAKANLLTEEQKEKYRWENMITQHSFDALSKMADRQLYELDARGRLADAQARLQDWLRTNKGPKEIEEINAHIGNLAAQKKYFEAQEYATRKQVPLTLTNLLMSAYKTYQEGANEEQEREMRKPVKKWIEDKLSGDDIGSDAMKLLYLWFTGDPTK